MGRRLHHLRIAGEGVNELADHPPRTAETDNPETASDLIILARTLGSEGELARERASRPGGRL